MKTSPPTATMPRMVNVAETAVLFWKKDSPEAVVGAAASEVELEVWDGKKLE